MNRRRVFQSFSLTLVLALLLTACGSKPAQQPEAPTSSPAPAPSTSTTTPAPAPKQTVDRPLMIATDTVRPDSGEFNPIWTHTLGQVSIMNWIWMGVGKFDETYTPEPWLVKNMTLSPDCTKVNLELRPEAKWSDGKPLTAHDIEFTYRLYLHKDISQAATWVVSKITKIKGAAEFRKLPSDQQKNAKIEGIKILNDHAMELTLEPDCLWLFDQHISVAGIQPKHILEQHWSDINNAPYFRNPTVTSGPYKFVKLELDTYLEMERWDDWWGNSIFGQPAIKKVFVKEYGTNQQAQHADLEAGELHMGWIDASELDRFKQMPKLDVIVHPSTGIDVYFFNMRKFPDSRVLQAFDYALDKQEVLKVANFGVGKPMPTTILGPEWAVDPSLKVRPKDITKAKALLKEANYDTSKKLKFIMITANKRGELFQAAMKELGIEVELVVMSAAPWREALAAGDYDVSIVGGGVLGTDPSVSCIYFASPSIWADTWQHYKNPRIQQLCKDIVATLDIEKRKAMAYEMQKILHNDLPWIMIGQQETIFVVDKRLGGFKPTITSNRRAPDLLGEWFWKE